MASVTAKGNLLQSTGNSWAGDYFNRDSLMPGGAKLDKSQFFAEDAVMITTTAQANAAATSIAVTALSGKIPSGTMLKFSNNALAITSAEAAAGATTLPVEALAANVANAATAVYAGIGKKTVVSGSPVGRTIAERDAGTAYGPAVSTDDEIYLLAHDVTDVNIDNDCELYRHGRIVKENFLPGWSAMATALQTKLRALYTMTRGTV
jgi:hypothetical protein